VHIHLEVVEGDLEGIHQVRARELGRQGVRMATGMDIEMEGNRIIHLEVCAGRLEVDLVDLG
jgi:hypothetical protein